MDIEDIYQDIILDHYKNPKNYGELKNADYVAVARNPLCGDEIRMGLCLDDGVITDVLFSGKGCAISQASASLLTNKVKGKSVKEFEELMGIFSNLLEIKDDGIEIEEDDLGEMVALKGVAKFPARIKCAMLSFHALRDAIKKISVE